MSKCPHTMKADNGDTIMCCDCGKILGPSRPSKTWHVELSGTITRDIIWRECDAEDEAEVRRICKASLPSYRVRSILPAPRENSKG
jgi:hypothetical protein